MKPFLFTKVILTGELSTPVLAGCVLCIAGLTAWTYYKLDPQLGWKKKCTIAVLRLSILASIIFLLLQPAIMHINHVPRQKRLAVLLDTSGSMHLAPTSGNPPIETALTVAEKTEKEAPDHTKLLLFSFSDQLHAHKSVTDIRRQPASFTSTDIASALSSLTAFHKNTPFSAVVVISDGASTSTVSPQAIARQIPVPINTVFVGGNTAVVDYRIKHISVDPFSFVRNRTPIRIVVDSTQAQTATVPVSLYKDGQLIEKRQITLENGDGSTTVNVIPDKEGRHIYTAIIYPGDDDTFPDNNVQHVELNAIRDKYRILHLSGQPDWNQRFLRDTLQEWHKIDLVSFYVLRTVHQSTTQDASDMALIPFPTNELFENHLDEFDILIFQNFDPALVGVDRYSDHIARFIENGGGVLLAGGPQTMSSSTIARSKLSEALPVRLIHDKSLASRNQISSPFYPHITSAGKQHPVLSFIHNAGPSVLRSLSKLNHVDNVDRINPDAIVLLEHPHSRCANAATPIVTLGEHVKGRTMVISTTDLWKWRFSSPMAQGATDAYATMIQQSVRWLSHSPQLERLSVSLDNEKVSRNDPADIRTTLVDASYTPLEGDTVSIEIQWQDRTGTMHTSKQSGITDSSGSALFRWHPETDGPHMVSASTSNGDISATTAFLVHRINIESDYLHPNQSFLKKLSHHAKGSHIATAPVTLDLDRLTTQESNEDHARFRRTIPIWSHPASLSLLLLLLLAEWTLRKKFGTR